MGHAGPEYMLDVLYAGVIESVNHAFDHLQEGRMGLFRWVSLARLV